MKKIIVSSLILSFFCSMTFATSIRFDTKSPLDAANFLAQKGIIVDKSNSPELYSLDSSIQRQAVMKIIMKLSERTIPNTCRGEFIDVDINDWPCKYIEAALDAGYISPNTHFRPYDPITVTEAMKLVLKAKEIEKVQVTDNWHKDYAVTAIVYGIVNDAYSNYNENATRGWIFQIVTATIEKEEEIKMKQEENLISNEAL